MLETGARRIYGFGSPWEWDGRWLVVVLRVPEERRDVRHQARTQLAWAGFGSLGGGLWISPHAEREGELRGLSGEGSAAELLSLRAEFGSLGDPRKIVEEAWDLEAVSTAYSTFVDDFARRRPRTPEAVFAAQTMLVHEWRKFPFLDPDLPAEMLPAGWPRERAHELFTDRHEAWSAIARDYFGSLEAERRAA
jgi:phenylacetic acid degradation operon negative regulatory protein